MGQNGQHEIAVEPPGVLLPDVPEVDYHAQWQAFSLRRNLAFFLLYGWVPVCIALFWISRLGWHQPLIAVALMLVWLGAALAAVYWAGEFRCPRCRRRYGALGHRKGDVNLTRGIFDKVCSNCKLRKFERL
jgi:hypothetical protein